MKNHLISHRNSKQFKQNRIAKLLIAAILWALWLFVYPCLSTNDNYIDSEVIVDSKKPFRADSNIRVLTWNLHNYNYIARWNNGKYFKSPKSESEKRALTETLSKIKPDVILIQEIGDISYLKEFQQSLNSAGLAYPYTALTSHNSPVRLGVLSRIKISKTFDFSDTYFYYKDKKTYSNRGTLGVKFSSNDVDWYVFTVHLKSAYGAEKTDENFIPYRFVELRAIDKRISNAIGYNAPLLIAGDFNQEPSSAFFRNFKNLNMNLLEQSDSLNQRYTYWWRKKDKFFEYDYFMYSNAMSKYISNKATIVENTQSASDHRPVYVDIIF